MSRRARSTARERLVERLREAGLSTQRFIDVEHRKVAYDHTNHGPTGVSGNYGVYAGEGLVAIDIDGYNDGCDADTLERVRGLPETFTVHSPHTTDERDGHTYYHVVNDIDDRELSDVFEDEFGRPNPRPSFGEIQVKNTFVVGPGSQLDDCDKCDDCSDPDGGWYRIHNDVPIATLPLSELLDVLRTDPKLSPRQERTQQSDETVAVDIEPIDVDEGNVAVVEPCIREFMHDSTTSERARDYLADLWRGRYAERDFDYADNAEVCLASRLYGILETYGEDIDNPAAHVHAYVTDACEQWRTTDTGSVRPWLQRGEDYRQQTIEHAIETFEPETHERWQRKLSDERREARRRSGEYSDLTYEMVQKAVEDLVEDGYPTSDEIVSAAQELDPGPEEPSHKTALSRLVNEHGQVKHARCYSRPNGERYIYYPAHMPDPDDADKIVTSDDEYEPVATESGLSTETQHKDVSEREREQVHPKTVHGDRWPDERDNSAATRTATRDERATPQRTRDTSQSSTESDTADADGDSDDRDGVVRRLSEHNADRSCACCGQRADYYLLVDGLSTFRCRQHVPEKYHDRMDMPAQPASQSVATDGGEPPPD